MRRNVTKTDFFRLPIKSRQLNNFELTYRENYQLVFRLACKLTGNRSLSADIAQEVFTDLYQQIKKQKEIRSLKSWLYKVTNNKCIDHLKSESRLFVKNESKEFNTQVEDEPEQDFSQIVREAINRLKENDKLLVILYSEGLSYKEISEISGINFTSVGKTLARALKKLEKELKPKYYELLVG